MNRLFIALLVIILTGPLFSTKPFQPVQPKVEYETQYDVMHNKWVTEPKGSEPTYIPQTNEWKMRPEGYQPQFNSFENKWE